MFKGDDKALDDLRRQMMRAVSGRTMASMQRKLQHGAMKEIDAGFVGSKAPDDEPWEPLKVRDGMPLVDSGKLWRGFQKGSVSGKSFEIMNTTDYAATHQDGAHLKGPGVFPVYSGSKFRQRKRKPNKLLPSVKDNGVLTWIHYNEVDIPARQMVPEGFLPKRWKDRFELIIAAHLEAIFK